MYVIIFHWCGSSEICLPQVKLSFSKMCSTPVWWEADCCSCTFALITQVCLKPSQCSCECRLHMRVKDKRSSWSLYGDQLWLLPQVQAEITVSQHLPLPLPVFPAHFPLRVQQSTALGTPHLWDIPTSFTPVAMETATDMPRRCKHPKLGVFQDRNSAFPFFSSTHQPCLNLGMVGDAAEIQNTKFVAGSLHHGLF